VATPESDYNPARSIPDKSQGAICPGEDPNLPAATEVMHRWGTRTPQSFDKPKYPNCKK